jgi:hypothetical protein
LLKSSYKKEPFKQLRASHEPFNGAGSVSRKSNRLNSPGLSGIAKIIECSFHCNLSFIPSSPNKFCILGYAPTEEGRENKLLLRKIVKIQF